MAVTKWTEGGGRSSVTYQGEQVFINSVNYFFGKEGAEPIEVSAGVHLYKFSVRIPKNAPGTAEGKFGFIRYKVDVNLDIPYLPDLFTEKHFVVMRHEDLNMFPELKIANEVEEAQTFCCLFCESDPLLVKVSTPTTGFVLGEKVPVKVEIFNRSNVKFAKSLISLNRIESFNSFTPLEKTKKHITPITAVNSEGVDPKKNVSFQEFLNIPQNAIISNDRISNVFQITYEVKFYMKASKKSSSSVKISLPIYIGTVGFRGDTSASTASYDMASKPVDDLRKKILLMKLKISLIDKFILAPFCKIDGNVRPRYTQNLDFVV